MSKPKLVLTANPSFKAKVEIPVAGSKPAEVEFVFRHKSKDALKEWLEAMQDKEEADAIMEIASGWDLEDPFEKTAVEKLAQNYVGSIGAIIAKYISELTGKTLGN
jgi:hypothetical protein